MPTINKKPGLDQVVLEVTKELYKKKSKRRENKKNELYPDEIEFFDGLETAKDGGNPKISVQLIAQELIDYLFRNNLGLIYTSRLIEEASILGNSDSYLPKNEEMINEYFNTFPKIDIIPIPLYYNPVARYKNIMFPKIVGVLTSIFFHLTNKSKSNRFSFPDSWSDIPYALIGVRSPNKIPIKIYGKKIGPFGLNHAMNIQFEFDEAGKYFLYQAANCTGKIRKADEYLANDGRCLELTIESAGDHSFSSIKDSKITARKAGDYLGIHANCSLFQVDQVEDRALGWSFNSRLTAEKIGSYAGYEAAMAVIHTKSAGDNFLNDAYHSIGIVDRLGNNAGLNAINCLINNNQVHCKPFEKYNFENLLNENLIFNYDLEHFATDREFAKFLPSVNPEFIDKLAKQAEVMPRPDYYWENYEYDHAKEFILKLKN